VRDTQHAGITQQLRDGFTAENYFIAERAFVMIFQKKRN